MKKNKVKFITYTSLIAAMYAVITIVFSSLSYGEVQFRISEILVLFALIEPKYITGLVLGCILANIPSPLGIIDVFSGSLATFIGVLFIIFIGKVFGLNKKSFIIASIGPIVSNAIIVGLELNYLFGTPFWMNVLYVGFGEFVVITILGTIVMNIIIKNDKFIEKIKI